MLTNLREPLDQAIRPLFQVLPPERAMGHLVGEGERNEAVELVEKILRDPALEGRHDLGAGLWLYVDQLDRSHRLSQQDESPTGSFWHAIMHRREGDFSNSKYWYRRAGHHPAMSRIDVGGGSAAAGTSIGSYEPFTFVDRVERCHDKQAKCEELVSVQRREWAALFEWCAEHD